MPGLRSTQVRISIWIDRQDIIEFNKLYPFSGAFTTFVRKALDVRLKKVTHDVEEILNDS